MLFLGSGLDVSKIARIWLAKSVIGQIINVEIKVLERLAPKGYVSFHGEYWKAKAEETMEARGEGSDSRQGWGGAEGQT